MATDFMGREINAGELLTPAQISQMYPVGTPEYTAAMDKWTGAGKTGLGLDTGTTGGFTPETGMTGMEQGQLALGAGQLGLGIAGYLDNRKTAKKNRELLDQQIASNRDLLQTRKARAGDISAAFGRKPGLGA